MGLLDTEVGVAVAATAAVLSPRTRGAMRKGAAYGLAGALKAGDVVVSTTRGAVRGAREGIGGDGAESPAPAARAPSGRAAASKRRAGTRTTAST